MGSEQSSNCWTALDAVTPKWEQADPKELEFSKSNSFSLAKQLGHLDMNLALSEDESFTEPALFGIGAAKLLAFRSPEDGSSQEFDFVLGDFSEIRDWVTIYLTEKIGSLSDSLRPLAFDATVPFILLQILDNVYDVGKSLIDFFVERAIAKAMERRSEKLHEVEVGLEDFACIDFDFILSNLSPLRYKFGYRLKDISDVVFAEDTVCRACGLPRDGRKKVRKPTKPTKPRAASSKKKKKGARKPVKKEGPINDDATLSSHASSSETVILAPDKSRRMSVRLANSPLPREPNASLSVVQSQPVPKIVSKSDVTLLSYTNMPTIAAPNCTLTNGSFAPDGPSTFQPIVHGLSHYPRIMASGLPSCSLAAPSAISYIDRKGKRKARSESPTQQDADHDAEASFFMSLPEGLPPSYFTSAGPPAASGSGLKIVLPRRGEASRQTTPPPSR